ncbi:hypothetical protein [Thomasclavelia ramosa]|uniref:hypothetical protein n=1 Tax=Thomasclavelia ramosa TaxID=1547 RepID=UPI001D0949C7|nr:hypothetical protein [Thomasclavelia ramosa]MCB6435846.1 hypothetical protein [Thomasclavelia ramosa]MCB6458895.1 hypothetical protein [Thomasclavelia ramosa]MCB6597125.1 hypothetical protein [Thomasclavelia ramosa]MCB6600616.1 hypothetical protein [Thomasclavelia ramosa]MCB6618705.1 hypothetical protein [Thomasclavelia ramosa]
MTSKKNKPFRKGDIIRTNPEKGFYGIAIVLDDGVKTELSPGRWSYPLCHIAITSLLFDYEISIDEINITDLKPMYFVTYFKRNDGEKIPWRNKVCIDIYTTRNKANLPIIGNIDISSVWDGELSFIVSQDGFHSCGDVSNSLGREAYIAWCRKNNIEL